MTRAWRPLVIACALGVSVGVIGAGWCRFFHVHRHWGDGEFQARTLQRFSSRLHLTPEQRRQVAAILEAKRQKLDALRAEIQPRFAEIRASTAAEIRRLLTLEQQKTFDVMQTEWDARMKTWRHREPMK